MKKTICAADLNQTWEFETNIGTFEYRLTGFRRDYTLGQIRQKGTEEWFDAHWASEVGPSAFELGVDQAHLNLED